MENLRNNQKMTVKIWGKETEVEVYSVRIAYDEPDDDTLDEKEKELLDFVLNNNLVEDESVKEQVLDYINGVYEEIGEPSVESIDPPEVSITTLVVDEWNGVVAFCGECQCDDEHGISISFAKGKFACVGEYMDYEFAADEVE